MKKIWYAILMDDFDNDWGTGSFDEKKACQKARDMGAKKIAEIDADYDEDGEPHSDPICIREYDVPDYAKYIKYMRKDLGVSRAEFSKRYNIPVRTLESWESGDREAPEYVIDLLGRAVYSDINNKKPIFYVVAIGKHDEWDCGKFENYKKAFDTAIENWEKRLSDQDFDVEIRIYVEDIEDEDCINMDCDLVSFKE